MSNILSSLMGELAIDWGVSKFEQDDDGNYLIEFDGFFIATCYSYKNKIFCETKLLDLPVNEMDAERIMQRALQIIMIRARGQSDCLILDSENELCLQFHVNSENFDKVEFKERLGLHLVLAELLTEQLEDVLPGVLSRYAPVQYP